MGVCRNKNVYSPTSANLANTTAFRGTVFFCNFCRVRLFWLFAFHFFIKFLRIHFIITISYIHLIYISIKIYNLCKNKRGLAILFLQEIFVWAPLAVMFSDERGTLDWLAKGPWIFEYLVEGGGLRRMDNEREWVKGTAPLLLWKYHQVHECVWVCVWVCVCVCVCRRHTPLRISERKREREREKWESQT